MLSHDKYQEGHAAFAKGDFKLAIKSFLDYQAEDEASVGKANQMLAESYLELGDFAKARDYYLLSAMPAQAGFAMILARDIAKATELYKEAPNSLAKNWGEFLCGFYGDDNPNTVLPGFLTFRLFFESTIAYFIRFKLLNYLELFLVNAKAITDYFPELHKQIGSAYLSLEEYEAAEDFFLEAINICPQDVEIYYKLGEVYFLTNRIEQAKEAFNKVLASIKGHKASLKYLEKIDS